MFDSSTSNGSTSDPGPLAGIRILDFTQMMLGPFATQLLGDLGADVIKVERPGTGEWERHLNMMGELLEEDSAAFLAMNRNKRSITVDMKNPEGVDLLLQLGETCDVVVENFRPGVMGRLGLGYEDFQQRKPDIIYCSGSGWGQDTLSAKENRPGQDLLIQAMSGIAYNNGRADDPPIPTGNSLCDASAAQSLALGILSALLVRERRGIGQRVEVDLFSTTMAIQCQEISAMVNRKEEHQPERSTAGIGQPWIDAPFGIYETKDGYLALSMTPLDKLGELLDDPDLAEFHPWSDREAIKERLDKVFPNKTTEEWLEHLRPADVWVTPVRTNLDAVHELREENSPLIFTVDHPRAGKLELIGCPITLSETPWSCRHPPPLVGEHTSDVLQEVFDEDEVQRLFDAGVVS